MTEVHFGIDVSNHQGYIDWSRVVGSGIEFALVKVSEGSTFTDSYGLGHLRTLGDMRSIPFGGYHFLTAGSSGTLQARHFLNNLANPRGDITGRLAVLDVEAPGTWIRGPEFMREFARLAPGHPLLVYSNAGLWSRSGGTTLDPWPFAVGWHAGTRNGAYSPLRGSVAGTWPGVTALRLSSFGGLRSCPLVQHTDRAQVPGITGGVDGNVWLGTMQNLRALGRPVGATPKEEGDSQMFIRVRISSTETRYYLVWGNGDRLGYAWLPDGLAGAMLSGGRDVDATLGAADFTELCRVTSGGPSSVEVVSKALVSTLAEVLPHGVGIDVTALAEQVVAKVAPALTEDLAAGIAAEVGDELGRRLQA